MSGGSARNYRLTYETGTFEVTRAPLLIDINNVSRVYGAANPAFTTTTSGLRNGDTLASLGYETSTGAPVVANTPVGSYLLSGRLPTAANYTVQINPGMFSITPALLTVNICCSGVGAEYDACPLCPTAPISR